MRAICPHRVNFMQTSPATRTPETRPQAPLKLVEPGEHGHDPQLGCGIRAKLSFWQAAMTSLVTRRACSFGAAADEVALQKLVLRSVHNLNDWPQLFPALFDLAHRFDQAQAQAQAVLPGTKVCAVQKFF